MTRVVSAGISIARTHVRSLAVLAAAAVAVLALSSGVGSAANTGRTVRSQGDEQFVPNSKIMATLKFSPGHITIKSGDTLTFEHGDKTEDPHTLSIVDAADVPSTIDDVFNCGSPGTICDEVFQQFPGQPSGSEFVNVSGDAGLDGRLDTLFLLPGDSVSAPVTAAPGTTLYFMCAIHAWMQGTIDVQ